MEVQLLAGRGPLVPLPEDLLVVARATQQQAVHFAHNPAYSFCLTASRGILPDCGTGTPCYQVLVSYAEISGKAHRLVETERWLGVSSLYAEARDYAARALAVVAAGMKFMEVASPTHASFIRIMPPAQRELFGRGLKLAADSFPFTKVLVTELPSWPSLQPCHNPGRRGVDEDLDCRIYWRPVPCGSCVPCEARAMLVTPLHVETPALSTLRVVDLQ